jgi:hypothetical protein
MGETMPFYRIYLLTAEDHIARRHDADCDCHASALHFAAEVCDGHPAVEIWHGKQMVARCGSGELIRLRAPASKNVTVDRAYALISRNHSLLAQAKEARLRTAMLAEPHPKRACVHSWAARDCWQYQSLTTPCADVPAMRAANQVAEVALTWMPEPKRRAS